ncbi:MAG: hypothetical protein WCX93_05105 [Burkholderiaceae bacterium]
MAPKNTIEKLKEAVVNERNFKKIWNAFFDLSEHPRFIRESSPSQDEDLPLMLEMACEKQAGPDKIHSLLICRYGKTSFYHGPFQIGAKQATFLYFKDIRTGMIVVYTGGSGIEMSRFTADIVETDGFIPPLDHGSEPSVH